MNYKLIDSIKYTYFYWLFFNIKSNKLINYTERHEKNVEVCKLWTVYKVSYIANYNKFISKINFGMVIAIYICIRIKKKV